MLKKLTKNVWFRDEKWKVHSIISPNKWDDFIILSRPLDEMGHPDGSIPIEMILVDPRNDVLYPDNPKTGEIMRRRAARNFLNNQNYKEEKAILEKEWFKLFPNL